MANYDSANVHVFPSTNLEDDAESKYTTEKNVSKLMKDLGVRNHVISGFESDNPTVGTLYLNGYHIDTLASVNVGAEGEFLYIHIIKDSDGNIPANIQEITTEDDETYVLGTDKVGVIIERLSSKQDNENYLLLGSYDGSTFVPSKDRDIVLDGGTW